MEKSDSERLQEAAERVLCRQDGGEELLDAIEAVFPDYGGLEFRARLYLYITGRTLGAS